jgi:hypothetical protein
MPRHRPFTDPAMRGMTSRKRRKHAGQNVSVRGHLVTMRNPSIVVTGMNVLLLCAGRLEEWFCPRNLRRSPFRPRSCGLLKAHTSRGVYEEATGQENDAHCTHAWSSIIPQVYMNPRASMRARAPLRELSRSRTAGGLAAVRGDHSSEKTVWLVR